MGMGAAVVVRVEGVKVKAVLVDTTEVEAKVAAVVKGVLEYSAEAVRELVGAVVKAQVNSVVEMVGA